MTTLVEIPFKSTTITAMSDEGKPLVSLRHMCESIGVDFAGQFTKLKKKSWAVVVLNSTTGADGKNYQMTMIDRRTMTMWLATIEPTRVKPEARPMLEAFQNEAADALDAYFHEGGAVNPNATPEQLDSVITRAQTARAQANVITALRGVIDPVFLENKARIVLARALGEVPEIAPESLPLNVEDFLKTKGLKGAELKSVRSTFGRRLSTLYKATHGRAPGKAQNEVNSGIRAVNSYVNADLPLFDEVWEQFYADLYPVLDLSAA